MNKTPLRTAASEVHSIAVDLLVRVRRDICSVNVNEEDHVTCDMNVFHFVKVIDSELS